MYKLSYYTIISDSVDKENHRLAYSTRSGDMVLLNEVSYDFIHNNLIESIPLAVQAKLINKGILVPQEEDELRTVIEENRASGKDDHGQLSEVIQPSAMCQLGCYYCGQQHIKKNISDNLIDKLVDRIYTKFTSGNYRSIYIGWFGAEPLMGLPQMRAIYDRLRGKISDLTIPIGGKIVTNGLSLKAGVFQELVDHLHIDSIEITLDGVAEYHDQHRFMKAGGPSFEIIYQNIKKIIESDYFDRTKTKISIRCNVDEANVAGIEPLIRKIAADQLHQSIASLYFIGIYSWGGNEAHTKSLTKEHFSRLRLEWEILKVKLGYPYKVSARKSILHSRKYNTCMATGGEGEMYDAFGNVYNCTEVSYSDFYENKGYLLGNVERDTLKRFDSKPHNDWFDIVHNTDKYPCHGCRLLPICGGSCPKSWVEGIPACPPYKYNIVKEMELKYLLQITPAEKLAEVLSGFEASFVAANFERYN